MEKILQICYRSDEDDSSLKYNVIEEKKKIAKHVEFYFQHKSQIKNVLAKLCAYKMSSTK